MEKLDLSRKNLKKFGITMAIAFAVITLIIFFKHRHSIIPTLIVSALFCLFAFGFPMVLKPAYSLWMRLAFVLSWVNTRLILIVVFYLIFTPISLCLKLFGKDLLDIRTQKGRDSYWRKREELQRDKATYEKQF